MWHALRGSEYDLDVDVEKILKVEEMFQDHMKDYFLPPEAVRVEPLIPWSPMPGGALTANTQMLRDNNMMHRFGDVIKAMEEVVRRGGFGTSVTPVSQFYFQQAFNNVMFGPWEKIADGYGRMVLGYFGKTPVAPDPEIVRIAASQMGLEPTKEIPINIDNANPAKGMAAAQKALKDAGLPETEENIFIAATCREKGISFLKGSAELANGKRSKRRRRKSAPAASGSGKIYRNRKRQELFSSPLKTARAIVNGTPTTPSIPEGKLSLTNSPKHQ
jgi:pyruvate carboxylase subunit B